MYFPQYGTRSIINLPEPYGVCYTNYPEFPNVMQGSYAIEDPLAFVRSEAVNSQIHFPTRQPPYASALSEFQISSKPKSNEPAQR